MLSKTGYRIKWEYSNTTFTWLDLTSLLKNDVGLIRFDLASFRDEFQLFHGEMEIRMDRVEGMANQSRAEMLNLRADFKEQISG